MEKSKLSADEGPEELFEDDWNQQGQRPVLENVILVCFDHITQPDIVCETIIACVVICCVENVFLIQISLFCFLKH